jgi:hypothetical protein
MQITSWRHLGDFRFIKEDGDLEYRIYPVLYTLFKWEIRENNTLLKTGTTTSHLAAANILKDIRL